VVPLLLSIGLVVVGLLILTAVIVPVLRSIRRFVGTAALVNDRLDDGSGLLRARIAALGVAIRQRRRVRIESDSPAYDRESSG
jgi:hypothetical protein